MMSGSCSLAVGEIMVFPFWIYMANKTIKTIRDETSVHLQNTVFCPSIVNVCIHSQKKVQRLSLGLDLFKRYTFVPDVGYQQIWP